MLNPMKLKLMTDIAKTMALNHPWTLVVTMSKPQADCWNTVQHLRDALMAHHTMSSIVKCIDLWSCMTTVLQTTKPNILPTTLKPGGQAAEAVPTSMSSHEALLRKLLLSEMDATYRQNGRDEPLRSRSHAGPLRQRRS